MLRYTLRTLLILLVVVLAGCDNRTGQKIETVRRGIEDVDRHAKEIEQTAAGGRELSNQDTAAREDTAAP